MYIYMYIYLKYIDVNDTDAYITFFKKSFQYCTFCQADEAQDFFGQSKE